MEFNELVKYVKKDGCMVRLYDRHELKVSQCSGTFDVSKRGNPVISLAVGGHAKLELTKTLLHEYAHFLQWKDGTLHIFEGKDLKDGWDHLDEWLRGRKRTKAQLSYSRNSTLVVEYDAEMRTLELSKSLNVNIGSHKEYIRDANSYVLLIKWCAANRKWDDRPNDKRISCKLKTLEELIAPLTKKEKEILKDSYGEG